MTGARRPFAWSEPQITTRKVYQKGVTLPLIPGLSGGHLAGVAGQRRGNGQPGLGSRRGGRGPRRRRSTRTSIRVIWRDPASSVRRATNCASRNRTWVANAGSSHATTSDSPSIATGRVRAAMPSPTTSRQRSNTTSMPARLGAPRRPRTRSRVSASRVGGDAVPGRGCQPMPTVNHPAKGRTVRLACHLPPSPRPPGAVARRPDGRPVGGRWPSSTPSAQAASWQAGPGCVRDRVR
jgi:hypothetical protein